MSDQTIPPGGQPGDLLVKKGKGWADMEWKPVRDLFFSDTLEPAVLLSNPLVRLPFDKMPYEAVRLSEVKRMLDRANTRQNKKLVTVTAILAAGIVTVAVLAKRKVG